ncbi:MAG TPA: hypothetical protein PKH60_03755 [Candidatus Woesebacteria bacterium]|jgi:hypothetical protein|nr:hypothetical protein [Candidatus Woesebacteria bacterium]
MNRGIEYKKGDEPAGGNDPNEWDPGETDKHYSDKGGHQKRGEENKKNPKRN